MTEPASPSGTDEARTPSQTVGPFFAIGLPWADGPYLVAEGTPGAIWLRGQVLDGDGQPVPDALVETWQADPEGHFDHPADPDRQAVSGFRAFGRCPTSADGSFAILTLKPGRVAGPDGRLQAPCIDIAIFARGLLKQLVTRAYFGDETEANAADPVLELVAPERRETLLAQPTDDGYVFDVHLQHDRETVFFDV